MRSDSRLATTAAAVWLVFVAVLYVPVAGRGFVKDDFAWVTSASEAVSSPLSVFVHDSAGTFYRPLVTLSFVADFAAYGLNPRGYGLTNVLLLAACAAAIVLLLRTLRVGAALAMLGALVWTINPHGVNMAVLWISGRTSLLMTLCSCLSVAAFLRGRRAAGGLLLLAALLAKEDALAIPIVVLAARRLSGQVGWRSLAGDAAWMTAAVVVYVGLRMQTDAITPATAPSFYQLTTDPALLLHNLVAYLDRSATGAAVMTLLALAVYRSRPAWTAEDRRLLLLAAIWFAAGIAITVRIPVRSSLYALFPSVGAALACTVVIRAMRGARADPARDRQLSFVLAATLLLVLALAPRNARWVEPARVSAQAVSRLQADAGGVPDHGVVVFEDSQERFANFRDAFGTLSPEAVRLVTGRALDTVVLPPGERHAREGEAVRYRVEGGQVRRVDAP